MRTAVWTTLAIVMLGVGCSKELLPETGDPEGTDNPDTDTRDPDSDSNDGDSDTNEVDDDIVDCRADYQTAAPGSGTSGGECTTDQLFCGDFVQATTVGGSTHYDTDQYEQAGIATGSENWDAPERAYTLRQPVGQAMRITFWGPCDDMDVAVCQGWECSDTAEVQQNDCSALLTRGDEGSFYRDFPAPSSGVREFEVVVDGRDDAQGNFALQVECFGG